MAPIRRGAPRPDFSSHPTDLELIDNYLKPWVTTGDRPWKFIHDADVYAANPEDLARTFSPALASDGQEAWYFFTPLRAKSRRGQRKSRTVGSGDDGCWHSERAAKPLFSGIVHIRQIGYRQAFSFTTKVDGRLVRSGWLMAEIGLTPSGSSEEELVLCKVYRTPREAPPTGSTAAARRVVPKIGRGKAGECSASSEENASGAGPAKASVYSAQPARASSSTDSAATESDSDQDSSSHVVIDTSLSAAPLRTQIQRVITGDAALTPRAEACRPPQVPFLPSSPIRRTSAAPRVAAVPSGSSAPPTRPDFAKHPSDQDLIKSYLIPRLASGEHPCKFTHDVDVYAAEPAVLSGQYSPATASDGEKAWYFFTTLPAKRIRGQRRPRTVGSGQGCWHSESGVRDVVDGDRQIGCRQFFSFMKKDEECGKSLRTGWIMVELGLNYGEHKGSSDELVLYKVYRSPRAGPATDADSTAATESSGRKRKASEENSGAESPARGTKKSTAPAASGRKKTDDKSYGAAACPPQLCTRCRIETAESHSGTACEEDETRGGSETGLLENDSLTDESAAPRGHERGESSGSGRTFYHFV